MPVTRNPDTRNAELAGQIFRLFDPATRQMSQMVGSEKFTPSDKAKKLLGWKPRNAEESIRDTAAQIVEKGMVTLTNDKRGQRD